MHFETAPAKINLTLDTLYKRDDGYHEVNMVMTTVDLKGRTSLFVCMGARSAGSDDEEVPGCQKKAGNASLQCNEGMLQRSL